MKCQFLKLDPTAKIPRRVESSIGLDLYLLKSVVISPGEFKTVGVGLVAIPPVGYHFEIVLCSSVLKKCPGLILVNHLIDPNYCGPEDEIELVFCNTSEFGKYEIANEEPIVQLVLRESLVCSPVEISKEKYNTYAISQKGKASNG